VSVGGVAHADPINPTTVRTVWAGTTNCAEGAITSHTVVDLPAGAAELRLSGWARPCPPPDPSAPFQVSIAFGVIAYNVWGGHIVGSTASGRQGQLFGVDVVIPLADESPTDRVWAVCLASSPEHRLSCVTVRPLSDGPPPGIPLSVDHPIVDVGMAVEGNRPDGVGGYCGGCVGWPIEG
jgi:hypothetical protein